MSPDVMAYNVMFRKIRYSRNYEAKNVCLTTTIVSAHLAAATKAISNTFYKAFQLIGTTTTSHYKDYINSKHLTLCCALSPHVGGGPPPTASIGLAPSLNNDNS
uniref:Uncharacterized protein n=1 Tax=Bactrocera dorsalis TaxID=27457 RepID=A0A034W3T6_BACDO